jgi:hypothetical protein
VRCFSVGRSGRCHIVQTREHSRGSGKCEFAGVKWRWSNER